MNNNLKLLQQEISKKTASIANQLLNFTSSYVNTFNQNDIFSFSRKDKQSNENEKRLEEYYTFLANISPLITELAALNAKLASLLIKADIAMDITLITECEKRFNAFELFESSSYEYTQSMELLFSSTSISISAIIKSTQKFKNAIDSLIKANT